MNKLKPITLRIPQEDYDHLEIEAEKLQIKPGTLARILLHSILSQNLGETDSQVPWERLQKITQRN